MALTIGIASVLFTWRDKLRQATASVCRITWNVRTWPANVRTRPTNFDFYPESSFKCTRASRRVASRRTSTSSHLHVRMPALPRHRKITKRIQEQKERWKAISIAARFKRNRISKRSHFLPLSRTSSSCIMSFLLSSFVKSNIISQRYQERSLPNKLLRTVSE